MNVIILFKMVPDVVEELDVGEDGRSLDTEWLRMILSEWCDHALEEAILLKERHGAAITVAALDAAEIDEALHTAIAKGADRVVKILGEFTPGDACAEGAAFAAFLQSSGVEITQETLILTGSQAIDDLQGEVGPILAESLGLPYLGVVTGITPAADPGKLNVVKEFASGLRGRFELDLPCVLGIQSAEQPPRYVPVAKVMAARKSGEIESFTAPTADGGAPGVMIEKMYKPEAVGRAEMLEGSPEEIAERLVGILSESGIV